MKHILNLSNERAFFTY
ncbi:unnamed protein product [Victoria cruziana]